MHNRDIEPLISDSNILVACFGLSAYAYLDGELHVKVSVAMDAIIRDLTKKRKATPAYLGTPTDVHVIPDDAHNQAESLFEEWNLTNILLKSSPFYLPFSPYLVRYRAL